MKILFTTSETGAFKELLNWEEVRDFYVNMFELSLPKTLDSAGRAAVDKSILLFNTKEMVESILIKEIQLFHSPYGYQYPFEEVSMPAELPTPFSDEPLPSIMKFKAHETTPGDDQFTLTMEQDIDKVGAEKLIKGLLKDRNPGNQSLQEMVDAIATFEIRDSSRYDIISSTGWLKNLYHVRTVKNGEIVQIDSCTIAMKE